MNIFKKLTNALLVLSFTPFIHSCISPSKTARPDKVVESMADALIKKYPKIPNIEVKQLGSSIPYILVDVREQKEIEISIIPGAITKQEFELKKETYKNKMIIPYCTIGLRSTIYTEKLLKEGFNAKNLKGGILSFAHAGFQFLKDGKETKEVHVFGEAWDLLPKDYHGIF
jgi:rhodanese-related sulfurtransferase